MVTGIGCVGNTKILRYRVLIFGSYLDDKGWTKPVTSVGVISRQASCGSCKSEFVEHRIYCNLATAAPGEGGVNLLCG